jgi:HemY protein
LRLSDSARDRLARMQVLVRMAPGHTESALAVARAALDARAFTTARTALENLAKEPTQRVAMLMAELEGLEGDEGRAREWMARALHAARDPVWTADGFVSERWLPVSPVTGRLDAFQWKVPVAELGERPLLEAESEGPTEAPALPREVPSPPLGNVEPAPAAAMPPAAPAVPRTPMRPAPIIPLTQVPDDPGPEPEDAELVTPGPWQRIRQLFR